MKTRELCKDFLEMQGGCTLDCIKAARLMNERWGIKVDHHEMAYALDYLERIGVATIASRGEFTTYYIG